MFHMKSYGSTHVEHVHHMSHMSPKVPINPFTTFGVRHLGADDRGGHRLVSLQPRLLLGLARRLRADG
jgi:hypothetical protein